LVVFIAERSAAGILVKLGDFGIAKFESDGTDTYVGSKNFMAPVRSIVSVNLSSRTDFPQEQRTANHDGRRTTTKSDIYTLGRE
jgi:serine/threonine protein kinase